MTKTPAVYNYSGIKAGLDKLQAEQAGQSDLAKEADRLMTPTGRVASAQIPRGGGYHASPTVPNMQAGITLPKIDPPKSIEVQATVSSPSWGYVQNNIYIGTLMNTDVNMGKAGRAHVYAIKNDHGTGYLAKIGYSGAKIPCQLLEFNGSWSVIGIALTPVTPNLTKAVAAPPVKNIQALVMVDPYHLIEVECPAGCGDGYIMAGTKYEAKYLNKAKGAPSGTFFYRIHDDNKTPCIIAVGNSDCAFLANNGRWIITNFVSPRPINAGASNSKPTSHMSGGLPRDDIKVRTDHIGSTLFGKFTRGKVYDASLSSHIPVPRLGAHPDAYQYSVCDDNGTKIYIIVGCNCGIIRGGTWEVVG